MKLKCQAADLVEASGGLEISVEGFLGNPTLVDPTQVFIRMRKVTRGLLAEPDALSISSTRAVAASRFQQIR